MPELAVAVLLVVAFFFLTLCWVGGSRARMFMLRALVPSFRFFDDAAPVPVLLVRTGIAADALGPYRAVLPPVGRTFGTLFVNAHGNLRLAYFGLLEQLVADLNHLPDNDSEAARALVSYELVQGLAHECAQRELVDAAVCFQFKLQLPSPSAHAEDLLVSAVHTI